MSKLTLEQLVKARDAAEYLHKKTADGATHPGDAQLMKEIWAGFNEDEAPPAIVKAMADELIELRQAQARRIAEKQAGLHHGAREGVQALVDMANAASANAAPARVRGVVYRHPISADNLPKDAPEALAAQEIPHAFDLPPEKAALCYNCGEVTEQLFSFRGQCLRCKNCFAEQCERVRCTRCGKVCTRPEAQHYCNGARYTKD